MDVCRLQVNNKKQVNRKMNNLGVDVGKKKCRASLKGEKGEIINEFFSNNN
jgi:hypothetical protein